MKTTRLEAFSDGVIAILITIMVLELKTPQGTIGRALRRTVDRCSAPTSSASCSSASTGTTTITCSTSASVVSGAVLWANLHLLFWLSLIPFTTAWMGESHVAALPTALYGFVLMMAGAAYFILKMTLIGAQGPGSKLEAALGSDFKGKISVVIYIAGMAMAFINTWVAVAIYVFVALLWLVPDRRIERRLGTHA